MNSHGTCQAWPLARCQAGSTDGNCWSTKKKPCAKSTAGRRSSSAMPRNIGSAKAGPSVAAASRVLGDAILMDGAIVARASLRGNGTCYETVPRPDPRAKLDPGAKLDPRAE